MNDKEKLLRAFSAFDAYNSRDPHVEEYDGKMQPKEFIYAVRMTDKLNEYQPDAAEHIQLAARCQHIGRWEVPRNSFPMDRKGYLQWRSQLALRHAEIAGRILDGCGYDHEMIEKVKFLLQKKQLHQHHPETQLLEDVICLVFIQHYLHEFSLQHEDDKVVDILRKTIKKMSPRALEETAKIQMSEKVGALVQEALKP